MSAYSPAVTAEKLLYLTELVAAIDRRVPQVQRAGESDIANAAVRLEAVKRIKELEQELAGRLPEDGRPAKSV